MQESKQKPRTSRDYDAAVPDGCKRCAAKHLTFCAHLEPAVRAHFQSLAEWRHLPKGEVLATEGTIGADHYGVIEGTMMSFKSLPGGRRQVVGFHFPGDFVTPGQIGGAWPVTARAITPCELCHVDWRDLRSAAKEHPALALALLDIACGEIAEQQDHLLTVGRKRTDEKVASFLLEMGRRIGEKSNRTTEIRLPMHRPEIADYLGLETETVSRVLSRWRKARVLDLPHPSRVVLRERDTLEALARGHREKNSRD